MVDKRIAAWGGKKFSSASTKELDQISKPLCQSIIPMCKKGIHVSDDQINFGEKSVLAVFCLTEEIRNGCNKQCCFCGVF